LVGSHPRAERARSARSPLGSLRRSWAETALGGSRVTLSEAAALADEYAQKGLERELATLRSQWDDEIEAAARNPDYRVRGQAYRAIAQFRFRQKIDLLPRGPEDESPAARGA